MLRRAVFAVREGTRDDLKGLLRKEAAGDPMKMGAELFWFLFCGIRERLGRMGTYGVAGLIMAVYWDVTGSRNDTVWMRGLMLTGLSVLLVLVILLIGRRYQPLTTTEATDSRRRVTKEHPRLPRSLHVCRDLTLFGLLASSQLFATGLGQIWVGSKSARSDSLPVSLFATWIPELRALRHEVAGVRQETALVAKEVAGVREDLGHVEEKVAETKKETSSDPRKELANLGIQWTTDAFVEALVTSDARAVKLFLAGGMKAETDHKGASAIVYVLQPSLPDPVPMLQLFVDAGYDPNSKLIDHRVLSHYSDHLPPHFEAPDLPEEYAAWQGTFAGPALLWIVIRSTYMTVTDSDRHAIQFLLQHGANTQLCREYLKATEESLSQYPAYQEIARLIQ
jgi:hypothetical protein